MPTPYTKDVVTSNDGTVIGYRKLGNGPALILLHGGMMASQNFRKLGASLADQFTVIIPDRRGRGMSGPYGAQHNLLKEAEDLRAVVQKTKAPFIFGLSSGALVTLQTALIEPAIKKIALFEPPINLGIPHAFDWVEKYERAMAKGKPGHALLRVIKGTDGNSFMTIMPRFIMGPLIHKALKSEAKSKKEDEVAVIDLIPTMHYDSQLAYKSANILEASKKLTAELLLIGGEKSMRYLKAALDALQRVHPQAQRITIPGVGHTAADNDEQPELVAAELKKFF